MIRGVSIVLPDTDNVKILKALFSLIEEDYLLLINKIEIASDNPWLKDGIYRRSEFDKALDTSSAAILLGEFWGITESMSYADILPGNYDQFIASIIDFVIFITDFSEIDIYIKNSSRAEKIYNLMTSTFAKSIVKYITDANDSRTVFSVY